MPEHSLKPFQYLSPYRLTPLIIAFVAACGLGQASPITVVVARQPSQLETLASREVVRYFYVRTGHLLKIDSHPVDARQTMIVVASKDRPILHGLHLGAKTTKQIESLKPQEFLLRRQGSKLLVIGGDPIGTLYGAYRFAECLGVRFYLDGDTVPDQFIPPALPTLDEIGKPNFLLRGIQPFHDFPEGPDWWNVEEYRSVIGQLAKLRMNFIGFHTYPEGGVGPEPLVWIGQTSDIRPDGTVGFSYPAEWASTTRIDRWGYAAMPTSRFCNGASEIFPGDFYGSEVASTPHLAKSEFDADNGVFNASGRLFASAFEFAHSLGVKTCVGTETPLTIPRMVSDRLSKEGRDPSSSTVVRDLYRGVFTRIRRAYPTDYYWLWTPEDWTWSGNSPTQFKRTIDDLKAAEEAMKEVGGPMQLATSGWVLGPQNDRAALDRILPKSVPMSTINRDVGYAPVEPGFGDIHGRSKWAIPWMENDPALTAPQLWAGRMRYDAADAYRLGCDGLLGIHWRTKILGPTIASLARAAWDPSLTDPRTVAPKKISNPSGAIGGSLAKFPQAIAGTEEPLVYQTCRYGMSGYDLRLPNNSYTLTLKFCEPFYNRSGQRVFSVLVDGKRMISDLDIFAQVGKDRALDYTFRDQIVRNGCMQIRFGPKNGLPAICGIVATSGAMSRRINCGGPAVIGYESDEMGDAWNDRNRTLPIHDFYVDFAKANFGSNVAESVGGIFAKIDGVNLPLPAAWIDGPGGIQVNPNPWSSEHLKYKFIDGLTRAGMTLEGAGNRHRFDYWLETFCYMKSMAEAGCLRGKLDNIIKNLQSVTGDADKKRLAGDALEVRSQLTRAWNQMMTHLLQAVGSAGELGTVSNLEQHVRAKEQFLTLHDAEIRKALGTPFPHDLEPERAYRGKPRIVVTTVRNLIEPKELLTIPVLILGGAADPRATLMWRRLGERDFQRKPLTHLGRGVYRATLHLDRDVNVGIEYYVTARGRGGEVLNFPATAPGLCQTVVTE